jgi:hypothetical protein
MPADDPPVCRVLRRVPEEARARRVVQLLLGLRRSAPEEAWPAVVVVAECQLRTGEKKRRGEPRDSHE